MQIAAQEVAKWLSWAEPGDRLTYHRGVLAINRLKTTGGGIRVYEDLDALATLLIKEELCGNVHLITRRQDEGDYIYIVEKKVPSLMDKLRYQSLGEDANPSRGTSHAWD